MLKKYNQNGTSVAVVTEPTTIPVIDTVQSALDLLLDARYNLGTDNNAIDKRYVTDEFFILSSGLAGEILQKFINYSWRIAFYGDFSVYTSKPLKDFIRESNKGRDVFFVANLEEAIDKLTL